MFIRFVSGDVHPESQASRGLFSAAYALRDAGNLDALERQWFAEVVGWFQEHLDAPEYTDFKLSYRSHEHDAAVFWFRDTATSFIQRMREVEALLKQHGIATRVLRTNRPGRIVYEDPHQVAAIPFRDGVR